MNNDYDRESRPSTYEEMVEAGYEMTGDGFWIPGDDVSTIPLSFADVKVLLLKSGETVISKMTESMYSGEYKLSDPKIVSYKETGEGDTIVSYRDWMPLSNTRELTIDKSHVVCITEPLKTLVENYLERKNG